MYGSDEASVDLFYFLQDEEFFAKLAIPVPLKCRFIKLVEM